MGVLLLGLVEGMLLGSGQVLGLDHLALDVHQVGVAFVAVVVRDGVHGGLIEPVDLLGQVIVYIERFGGV